MNHVSKCVAFSVCFSAIAIVASMAMPGDVWAATNLTELEVGSSVGDEQEATYALTADGQAAVYVQADSGSKNDLYAVRFDNPGAPITLVDLGPSDGNIRTLLLTEDSQFAVYAVRTTTGPTQLEQLFSARVDGVGSPVPLTDNISLLTAPGLRFQLSPNSNLVVYRHPDTDPVTFLPTEQLFSVPVTGGLPTALSDEVGSVTFEISQDGQRVAYVEFDFFSAMAGGVLKSVPAGGGTRSTISDTDEGVYDYEISRDSQKIAYAALLPDTSNKLVSRSLLGMLIADLDGFSAPVAAGDPTTILLQTTFDSLRVVYVFTDGSSRSTLKSVPIGGSPPSILDPSTNFILSFQLSRDSSQVLYSKVSDQFSPFGNELHSVPVTGGTPSHLSNGFAAGGFFVGFPTLDSQRVVFGRAALQSGGVDPEGFSAVYAMALDGSDVSGPGAPLNDPLVSGAHVRFFFPYFDSERVLYLADQNQNDIFELFEAPIDTASTVLQLNDPLVPGGQVLEGVLTPNDDVVYRADQDQDNVFDLFLSTTSPNDPLIFSDGFE